MCKSVLLQVTHLYRVVHEVKGSSLLTDEDAHLLSLILPELTPPPPPLLPPPNFTYLKWLSLLAVMVSMGWAMTHPHIMVIGVSFFFSLLLLFGHLISMWMGVVLDRAQAHRLDYYSSVDKLLTQFTSTIRWLQEIEVVSRGISCPISSLPINRLDRCHTHQLLRKHVLWTCEDVLCPLRATTRELFDEAFNLLVPEVGDRNRYLAFHPLSQLHQFLREEGGDKETHPEEDKQLYSLESIKVQTVKKVNR